MLIYELYKSLIRDGEGSLIDCFSFIFFSFLSLPMDLILSPLEILAFIIYKVRRSKTK